MLTYLLTVMSETGVVVLRTAIFGGLPNEISTLLDASNVYEALKGEHRTISNTFNTHDFFIF